MAPSFIELSILSILCSIGPSTASEVARAVNGHSKVLLGHLRSLKSQGLVREERRVRGGSVWTLSQGVDPETLPVVIVVTGPGIVVTGPGSEELTFTPCRAILAETGELCGIPALDGLCFVHDPANRVQP